MIRSIRVILILVLPALVLRAPAYGGEVEMITASQDALLAQYETSDRVFMRLQVGKTISYFHKRKIGDATVEKDFIRYQFDAETETLIDRTVRWRNDLPAEVTPLHSKADAESVVEGDVQSSRLYIISPESDVFPLEVTPQNPCWVVRSLHGERLIITVVDAITGEQLGYGIPPPYTGFSLGGPDWGSCDPHYTVWAQNAEYWFEYMGYDTEMIDSPSDAQVQGHIQSDSTAMFYELAHGNSWYFHNHCPNHEIESYEVEAWIAAYASMAFTFLGSCGGMCDLIDSTLSFEFRKGSNRGAVVVGYCGMNTPACEDCWDLSIEWQNALFEQMAAGQTVGDAFDAANADYLVCAAGNCMRIVGDTDLTVVPIVTRSLCGTIYDGLGGPLTQNSRDYYIRCDLTIPGGQTLTVDPQVWLAFLNNARIVADGTLTASGAGGEIRFVSAEDISRGMKFTGELRIFNGGEVKIYE